MEINNWILLLDLIVGILIGGLYVYWVFRNKIQKFKQGKSKLIELHEQDVIELKGRINERERANLELVRNNKKTNELLATYMSCFKSNGKPDQDKLDKRLGRV